MTTLTVKIADDKDLNILQGILDRFGLNYSVDEDNGYEFSELEIQSFIKTKVDYLDGKTTARDWKEIEEELKR